MFFKKENKKLENQSSEIIDNNEFNAENIKNKTIQVLNDKKRWDYITNIKIERITNNIQKRALNGCFSYYEHLTNYEGENMEAIRLHFEKLGFIVIDCKSYTDVLNPFIELKIEWR